MGKVQHLVVDTNAFLKAVPLQDYGEHIYTVSEVVSEIRDSATRERLRILPYEIQFREPSKESLAKVTSFSKATGDYPSLSAVDLKLIALTYELTLEKLEDPEALAEIKKDADEIRVEKSVVMGHKWAFGTPADDERKENMEGREVEDAMKELDLHGEDADDEESFDAEDEEDEDGSNDIEVDEEVDEKIEGECVEKQDVSNADNEDEDSDDEGWITPANYREKLREFSGEGDLDASEKAPIVSCLTADFAMQNVILHVGLKVTSSSGYQIRSLRTFILRCYACFRTTSIMTKVFCPACGNRTLKKVAVSTDPAGNQTIHLSKRVNITGRGKKFPLPPPQGGKHGINPQLTEDQRFPQQRLSKMAQKRNNPLASDWIAGSSPFATKDVVSKAAMLGINNGVSTPQYWDSKNPNAVRKSTGNRHGRKTRSGASGWL